MESRSWQGRDLSLDLSAVDVTLGNSLALSGIDLRIEEGEAVAFVGPSGAGKTTLLRLLAGGVRPSRGSFQISGRPFEQFSTQELRELRSKIGFVHQDLRLVPNIRVLKNVISGRLGQMSWVASLRAMLWPSKQQVSEVYEILERVGIPEKLYQQTRSLSGGQQQRVAVARALFQQPRVILADEPVSSVDPARARDTVELLIEICRQHRWTLCMSLHDIELARELFPRLVGLRQGKVMFDSARREVSDHGDSNVHDGSGVHGDSNVHGDSKIHSDIRSEQIEALYRLGSREVGDAE